MSTRSTLDARAARLETDKAADTVRTWADGYGMWHASVSVDVEHPERVARGAIRCELEQRGELGPGYRVRLRLVSDGRPAGHVCTMTPPCRPTRLHYVETAGA